MSSSISRTTAQVACEAIINDPYGYSIETMLAVYDFACESGVSSCYTEHLGDMIDYYRRNRSWTG